MSIGSSLQKSFFFTKKAEKKGIYSLFSPIRVIFTVNITFGCLNCMKHCYCMPGKYMQKSINKEMNSKGNDNMINKTEHSCLFCSGLGPSRPRGSCLLTERVHYSASRRPPSSSSPPPCDAPLGWAAQTAGGRGWPRPAGAPALWWRWRGWPERPEPDYTASNDRTPAAPARTDTRAGAPAGEQENCSWRSWNTALLGSISVTHLLTSLEKMSHQNVHFVM